MHTFRIFLTVAAACTAISTANIGHSQEPLRWKLKLGEKLEYRIVEDMSLTTGGDPLETTVAPVHQEIGMTWTVLGINDDGEAVVGVKFDDFKLSMTGPRGETIAYDSKGDEAAGSLAAMVAPIYEALTKGEFEFTMTARGETKDVEVPDEMLKALQRSPGAELLGDIATAKGIQRMITQWSLVLPEKAPQPGEEWRSELKLESPAGGEQVVESSYRYEGTREVDGRTYAVFRPGLEMKFAGKEGAATKVKKQTSGGEILFDVEAGQLVSASLKRDVTMEVSVAGQTVEQSVKQSVEVKKVE